MAEGDFSIENTLNASEIDLPFGLYNPETSGKLTWICGYGKTRDIVSVYCMELEGGQKEKQVSILENLAQAIHVRDTLKAHGWRILIPPKIEFKVTNKDGQRVDPNRKQRRYIERKAKQFSKQQAAMGDDGGLGAKSKE